MTTTNKNKNVTIEWEIADLDALDEFESRLRNINGSYWEVQPFIQGERLMFNINCNFNDDCFHVCKTAMHLEMKEEGTEMAPTIKNDLGSQYLINFFRPVLSTDAAMVKTGSFPKLLYMHIEVIWAPNERSLPTIDAFLHLKTLYSNFSSFGGLCYHTSIIPVNQHILAGYSGYFRELFFGKDAEKKRATTKKGAKLTFEIEKEANSDFTGFSLMICAAQLLGMQVHKLDYSRRNLDAKFQFTVNRCITILKIAAKFDLPMWLEYAEKMLIDAGPGTMEALELAESLKMPALKEHCLKTLDTLDFVKYFRMNKEIFGRLSEQTQAQVDKRLEYNANRYSRKRTKLDMDGEENDDDLKEYEMEMISKMIQ